MMHELRPNLFESDLKRAVDFGHSISPTLEAGTDYRLQHGEAVAIDMLFATAIGVHRELCPPALFDRLVTLYRVVGLPLRDDFCTGDFAMDALADVREHRGGHLNFLIPTGIGTYTYVQEISTDECERALEMMEYAACLQ
jgi:3-dehydroquinate synthase